ncbi:MAG: LuxR C-terminal-related transcriptional regulator [Paracoccaceae bacterium]
MTAAKAGTGAGSAGGILASFLDCIADPVQVDTLFEVINSWFDEEQEAFAIAALETYSETVWELLAAHCEAKERGGGARLDRIELTPQMIAAGQFRDGRGEERMIDAADLVRLGAATGAFRAGPGRLAFRHRHDPEGPAGFAILVADDTGITAWLAREGFDDLTVSFFQDAFGLSSSEIEVLVALLSGSRLRDIAQSRDRSLETVRNQIKAIAAKFGVAGQSDIIRVAQDIRAIETATRGASAEIADATGARRLRLPDGRDLVYDVFGDGRRETLVFFHCLTSGRHWSKGTREAFSAEGYRLSRFPAPAMAGRRRTPGQARTGWPSTPATRARF